MYYNSVVVLRPDNLYKATIRYSYMYFFSSEESETFKTLKEARVSSQKIFDMYLDYRIQKDFVGMDMCRKFLEMGFTRARRYANHKDGKKYGKDGKILPQEKDWATSEKAKSAQRFKDFRDLVTQDEFYISMRKQWRDKENVRRI